MSVRKSRQDRKAWIAMINNGDGDTSMKTKKTLMTSRQPTLRSLGAIPSSWCASVALLISLAFWGAPESARAESPPLAVDLRVGTIGIGGDVDVGLGSHFTVRLGYSDFTYNRDVNSSDVNYSGSLKLGGFSGLVDWNLFGGGFHISAGAMVNPLKIDVAGIPAADGSFTINNDTYTAGQVASLGGSLKIGNSVAPYIGLGWGNPVGSNGHWHVLFDVGALYGGTPKTSLQAGCGPAAPAGSAICAQLQTDVQAEDAKLQNNVSLVTWYPVINLGVSYRF
jgi:hypothetical protein